MNEGENNNFSGGPTFSSPNIAGSQPQPQSQATISMPEQPVDITKMSNPSLMTTVASMPEQDGPAKPAVTSGGDSIDKKKPRFGFAVRRFRDKTQASTGPVMRAADGQSFANTPEFFSDAMNDIVLADDVAAGRRGKAKKNATIAGVVVLVVALFVVGIMFMSGAISSGQKQAKATLANRLKNIIASGEDKPDEIEIKIEKAGDYRKLFIYKDAIDTSAPCVNINALIGEVSKTNNLGALPEEIANTCLDMSYRQIPIAVILKGSETLRYDGLSQYIDNIYKTRTAHSEKIEKLRIDQAYKSIEIIGGLSKAGCISGKEIKGACAYDYYGTDEYKRLSYPISDAELGYQREIMREIKSVLNTIDGTEVKNEQK